MNKWTKKLTGLVCALALMALCLATAVAENVSFAGGSGTKEDPYQIETLEQLQAMANDMAASYVLTADIDAGSVEEWTPIGTLVAIDEAGETPDPAYAFTGTFDGNGHTISNLNVVGTQMLSGLFGVTANAIHPGREDHPRHGGASRRASLLQVFPEIHRGEVCEGIRMDADHQGQHEGDIPPNGRYHDHELLLQARVHACLPGQHECRRGGSSGRCRPILRRILRGSPGPRPASREEELHLYEGRVLAEGCGTPDPFDAFQALRRHAHNASFQAPRDVAILQGPGKAAYGRRLCRYPGIMPRGHRQILWDGKGVILNKNL